jgi:prepilin-type N-terminal cleavage/methylation domain-containing protein
MARQTMSEHRSGQVRRLSHRSINSDAVVGRVGDKLSGRRCAFTLVELLVAVGLLLILATLALSIIPNVSQSQNTARAAAQLQQWIEIAKSRAARDRIPRGIRLICPPLPARPLIVQLEYIELPEPYTLHGFSSVTGTLKPSTAQVPGGGQTVTFTNNTKTLRGGVGISLLNPQPQLWPVQNGDYIELAGVVYQINGSPVNDTLLNLTTTVPAPVVTTNYKIIRQARPIGDDLMEMPQNIAIDLQWRFINSPTPLASFPGPWPPPSGSIPGPWDLPISPPQPLDIIFAPDGRVIPGPAPANSGGANLASFDKIVLWVRDITLPDGQGDPTLVVIYPRTGLIAAQPVDVDYLATSPYTFTTSGQRSSE